MATINPTREELDPKDGSCVKYVWASMANGDVGAPISMVPWADRCVQVAGTFGAGGTLVFQGSNNAGANYETLNNPASTALSFTAAGLKGILEVPQLARPAVTAGDGFTALTVSLVVRRANPLRT